ncbi:MAG: CDP-alcohol phosphatidyltransferase family protein [Proteobacteria bacterium]|nr:CDP-alcohol phosphatidyltransferase family protein [Pseudomonadota bacterium]
MYFGFVVALKTERGRDYLCRHWYYHPNAICVWRVFIGLAGTMLYFVIEQHTWGIFLFTVSAVLDGVDGLIARSCDLITPFGEEIDPLCDKLTYLPPMVYFAYDGLLSMTAVWTLLIIEACGQFLVRYIIKRSTKFSVAANNFGKIKAVLCFSLIIYCTLLSDALQLPDFSAEMLNLCIILSISSSAFKIIANRFYADILSILNLLCGVTGIFLVFQGRYVYTAIAILAGQIFDLFDGRMAEKHGGTKFGPWLDDIADMVSFGICPGLLIILKGNLGLPSFIFGALYCVSVGFRLWRYLVHDKHEKTLPPDAFNGLPSPAGAIVAVGACLFWKNLWIIWAVTLFISYLLVSHIRFIHFGKVMLRRVPRALVVIFGFVIVFIIAYIIKVKDSEMLGGLLLMSFLIYLITSSKMIIRKVT